MRCVANGPGDARITYEPLVPERRLGGPRVDLPRISARHRGDVQSECEPLGD